MHRPGFVGRGPWGPWGPRGPIVGPIPGRGGGDADLAVARGLDAASVSRPGYSGARICPIFATALYQSGVAGREYLGPNVGPDSGAGLGFVARRVFLEAGAPLIWQAPILLALIVSLGVAFHRKDKDVRILFQGIFTSERPRRNFVVQVFQDGIRNAVFFIPLFVWFL